MVKLFEKSYIPLISLPLPESLRYDHGRRSGMLDRLQYTGNRLGGVSPTRSEKPGGYVVTPIIVRL